MWTKSVFERISSVKNSRIKQVSLSIGEAYSLWICLVSRYDALQISNIFTHFVKDNDLKIILGKGINVLKKQINMLEKVLGEYGVPMPEKPPSKTNLSVDKNVISDQVIYREIFKGMRNISFSHLTNYIQSPSAMLRGLFKDLLLEEMNMYDSFYEYGKLKGFLHTPPYYNADL